MSGDVAYGGLAHAKLNLTLRVLAREASGYHQIETIFCALELADEIEISRTPGGVTLEVVQPPARPGLPPDLGRVEHNLAFRAASLFLSASALDGGVHIRLTKRIPAGAGLGGGSSDAAAVLRGLNRLPPRPLAMRELLELGARLGSDVPFFLTETALALAWGRGGRIAPLPPLPVAPIVLAVPPERVSTAEAYATLKTTHDASPQIVRAPDSWSDVAETARNDFEAMIFAQYPRLAGLRQMLEDAGAVVARMTGTGSVVFGVFDSAAPAAAAARAIADAHADIDAIVTQSRTA